MMAAPKMANREQYGHFNYAEGGTPDMFGGYEDALRGGAKDFNIGHVYDRPAKQQGGVLKGDTGLLRTREPWAFAGVVGAILRPVGITPGQTYLSQWGATPTRWDGDTPLELQDLPQRAAPWRRAALGNARGVYSSAFDRSNT